MEEMLYLPPVATKTAGAIDHILVEVHYLMLALFVAWLAYFIFALIRFNRKANPRAKYEGIKMNIPVILSILILLVEFYDLFAISIPFWSKSVQQLPPENEAVVINVSAEQFVWRFHYAGKDGKMGKKDIKQLDRDANPLGIDKNDVSSKDDVVTITEMFVPVDKPVIIKITAKDVIHAFGVHALRLKQDAIPGLVVPIGFTPTVTTADMRKKLGDDKFEYEIACSQLCGIGHSKMRGKVTVLDQASFDKKMAELSDAAAKGGSDEW